jgi:hypothetical protein
MTMPEPSQATSASERPADRRRVPRVPFRAASVITEADSSRVVSGKTSELSRFGCFVQTPNPLPQGSRIQLQMAEGGELFTASAKVAYITNEGMGIVFTLVEPESYQVLAKWLARTSRQSDRYDFRAPVEVKELGSWGQGLITRDLSAGGCFIKTAVPLSQGSRIRIRIEHAGTEFTALAKVTGNVSSEGMGVEFVEIEAKNRAILEKWLAEKSSR